MLERRPPKRPYRSSGEAFVGGDDTGNSLNVVVSVEDDLGNGTVGGEPSYYQRSILIILTSVRDVYGNILNEGEHCLLAKVLPAKAAGEGPKTESILSKDAQRLLFRLFLRRTDWLREGRLEYQDISSIRGAIDELHTEGLVECTMHSVDDVISILQLDELRELARNLGIKVTGKTVSLDECEGRMNEPVFNPFLREEPWWRASMRLEDLSNRDLPSSPTRAHRLVMRPMSGL